MTEKVCKLYEEEQTGKTREGRKVVPSNKMLDLAWDTAETQLIQEAQRENNTNMTPPLQTLVTVIILIIAIGKQTITQIKKITKKAVQVIENTTKEVKSQQYNQKHQRFPQNCNVNDNNTNQYDRPYQPQKTSPNKQQNYKTFPRHTKTQRWVRRIVPVAHIQDLQLLRQLVQPVAAQVSACFTQRPNVETETPEHKTLNNALVTTNEVLNTTCKYSVNHAPSHTSHRNSSG